MLLKCTADAVLRPLPPFDLIQLLSPACLKRMGIVGMEQIGIVGMERMGIVGMERMGIVGMACRLAPAL